MMHPMMRLIYISVEEQHNNVERIRKWISMNQMPMREYRWL